MPKKSAKRSEAEINLQYQMEDVGLPTPETEFDFSDDRKWRFDFAWPELMVAVEVEGGTYTAGRHVRPKGYESDCIKYSTAAIMGWIVIRATTGMINSGEAIKLIEMAVDKRYSM